MISLRKALVSLESLFFLSFFDALTGRQAVESQRLQRTFLLIILVPLASLFLFLPT